jgi:hypothetical protein
VVAGAAPGADRRAIARQVDDEAGLAQALAQVVAGLQLVFDDQDFQRDEPTR